MRRPILQSRSWSRVLRGYAIRRGGLIRLLILIAALAASALLHGPAQAQTTPVVEVSLPRADITVASGRRR